MSSFDSPSPDGDIDIRVEDYLDDKLQAPADLEALDELLASVELQRNQLQSQLDDAVKDLEQARRTTEDRGDTLQIRIDEFNALQASIDERVHIAAASDAPSEAIARLQRPMQKLKAVDMAQRYLIMLQDVENLRKEARSHLPDSPKAALEPYSQLKQLAMRLRSLPGSEDLHLVEHVEKVAETLWDEMKETMSVEMDAILTKRQWPRVDKESQMDQEWLACFEKLVDLQMPEILHSSDIIPLLPVDVMAKIFVAEFRFHFLSDKPTSAPQSMGTHCFPWFLSTVEKWEDFFRDNLAHLLAAKFVNTSAADKMIYVDPVCALITSLLTIMREKVLAVADEAVMNPSFLSGFMGQLMTFDENLRTRFNYDGGDSEDGWPGLTAEVLDEHFDAWFQAERTFALERFDSIMNSDDSRKIDYDFAETGKMKPTYAAVRTTDLLRTVTSKYDRLRKTKYKVKFLTKIQLDILDGYHDRLRGSLEAYQSMTSTLGRTLHGASKEQLAALQGLGALETLCKVIGSADHIVNCLTEWGDEEFFTVLWDELLRSDKAPEDDFQPSRDKDGAIFDETISAFAARRKTAEDLLVASLTDAHTKAFRGYAQKVQWTTVGESAMLDDLSDLSITPELDEPLAILKQNFEFLVKTLSSASYRRVWREALRKVQDLLWTSILMRQSFTTLGAAQFAFDQQALMAMVERYIPSGAGAFDMLSEGTRLLSLPTEGTPGVMTLKEASDRVFKDNDEARKVLEELRLEGLGNGNARAILQRRVENSENIGW
ncbi:hypothetical protein VHEMI07598 [[Torrubiella] hemipterigena]|uniref:RINT-1 family protein n=1 Tax=[Torrubiella] hemipterigena TaxID=1531966 RepID=A0A0A1TLL7_9HYPO|nr:hypothetical protein VHEMI07598 [[Torrubiella] hemipterigena]